jgi:MATE family multidrug resistance protein
MALTKYREGSIGELWVISLPLMITSFSVMFMIFVDRLLLANFSTEAFNAAVSASTIGWAFIAAFMGLCSISEVFVAQYNGAGRKERMGMPVWQMIWVGVFSIFIFFPLAQWGNSLIFSNSDQDLERLYFRWMIYFGPAIAIYGALAGFFVGQGKTKLITFASIGANFVNIALDWLLIFGVEGYLEPMGVKGAAISTSLGSIFQTAILFFVFMSPSNQSVHRTDNWRLNKEMMLRCLRIGLPGSVFMMVEILGWGVYYLMMAQAGFAYITIAGVAQSVVILFMFFAEAISKAATALCGNFIGSRTTWNIPKLLVSGVGLHVIFFICAGGIFALATDSIIKLFLPDLAPATIQELYQPLVTSLFLMLLYLLFEGIRFLLTGILTAAGDTMFIFIAGTTTIWFFLILPVWVAVFMFGASIVTASFLSSLYALIACLIYYFRFREGKWREGSLIDGDHPGELAS